MRLALMMPLAGTVGFLSAGLICCKPANTTTACCRSRKMCDGLEGKVVPAQAVFRATLSNSRLSTGRAPEAGVRTI